MGGRVSTGTVVKAGIGTLAVAGVLALSTRKAFANRVYMSAEVYKAYCGWRGRPAYYIYKAKGCSWHSGIVVRGTSDAGEIDGKWVIRCNATKWDPPTPESVELAVYEWDIASAFVMAAKVAQEFKLYNLICNNCRTFRTRLVERMKQGPPERPGLPSTEGKTPLSAAPPVCSLDELLELSLQLGVDFVLQAEERQREMFRADGPRPYSYLLPCA
jgi:hypothetical protein